MVSRALEIGLPVVASLSATVDDNGTAVLTDVSSGSTVDGGSDTVCEAVRRIANSGVAAICDMHSEIDEIDTILPAIREERSGPLGAYPNRTGLWDGRHWVFTEDVTPQAYADRARRWVDMGATIVGGCCGTTPAMIAAVSAALKS